MLQSFLGLLLIFANSAHADPLLKCDGMYQLQPAEVDAIRKDFVHDPEKWTYVIPHTPVENQCKSENCWIFGSDAELQEDMLKNTGVVLDLSEDFVAVQSLIVRAEDALMSPGQKITEGGWYPGARWLMLNRGLMPKSVWTPKVPINEGKAPDRILSLLNSRIAQFHMDVAKLPHDQQTLELVSKMLEDAKTDLMNTLKIYTGDIPTRFEVNGVAYDAISYAKAIIGEKNKSVSFVVSPPELPPSLVEYAKNKLEIDLPLINRIPDTPDFAMALPFEAIEQILIERAKLGLPTVAAIEINSAYIDDETGIMAFEAYHNPVGFVPTPREYRLKFDQAFGGHLIEFLDVEVVDGHINKIKIKNSWGPKAGNKGYYFPYRSYLKQYLNAIFFGESEAEIEAFKKKLQQ